MRNQKPWRKVLRRCSHTVGGACMTSVCWVVWVALAASLALLATIYFRREIDVPAFLLRRLEQKLEYAHLSARFGRTAFDPTGNLVLENVRLYGAGIEEPLAHAAAIRLHLDFWAVAGGDFDVNTIEVVGARLDCPALASPTGLSEAVVADLGATIRREQTRWQIPDASFHLGKVFVRAQVDWHLAPASGTARRQLSANLLKDYIALVRRIAVPLQETARLDDARIQVSVIGQPERHPVIHAEIAATRARLPREIVAEGVRIVADTAWRPGGLDPTSVAVSADSVTGPYGLSIDRARLQTDGRLEFQPIRWTGMPVHFSAAAIRRGPDSVTHPRATLHLEALPRFEAELAALVQGNSPLAVHAAVDTGARSAEVDLSGTFAPPLLNDAAARAAVWRRSRILAQLDFAGPAELRGHLSLDPGWKLREARATARLGAAVAYGTGLSATEAEVAITPERLLVQPLVFHAPDTEVAGSYEMDLRTQAYRFLLKGHFFPSLIDSWFSEWWTRLWADFKFGTRAPEADLDILGQWRAPEKSLVYGWADIRPVELRQVPFDRLQATIFIRPEHYDILSFDARRGDLFATGSFTRHDDSATKKPLWIGFDFHTTLPVAEGGRLFGPEGERTVEPFAFAEAPDIRAAGRMEWSGGVCHDDIRATASAPGVFRFHEFPVEDARIGFDLREGEILVHTIDAKLAGGALAGNATVTGPADARQLQFKGTLEQADLAGTVQTWMDYRTATSPPDTEALPDSAGRLGQKGRLDLVMEAAGPIEDLYALHGGGTATIRGAEIAEIEMFGALSRALRGTFLGFTSLQFSDADARFAINGEHLDFSTLKLTGASAAIHGKGRYTMPSSALNFNVALFPFRESNFPVFTLLGTVLTPLSHAFEVRLGGTLAKPEWTFAAGAGELFPALPDAPPVPPPANAPAAPVSEPGNDKETPGRPPAG